MSQLTGNTQRSFIDGVLYDYTNSRLGEHYSAYAVCQNCDKIRKHHQDDHCLFEASTFCPVFKNNEPRTAS
jgi:hypothetical protein